MSKQNVIVAEKTDYLYLISAGQNPVISACAGGPEANLLHAGETFTHFIDLDLKNELDNPQPATDEAEAEVWETYAQNGTIEDFFDFLLAKGRKPIWDSQEQIEKFCRENRSWLHPRGEGTYFFFSEESNHGKEIFAANVYWDAHGRLGVIFYKLTDTNHGVFGAYEHRFIVPANKNSIPEAA